MFQDLLKVLALSNRLNRARILPPRGSLLVAEHKQRITGDNAVKHGHIIVSSPRGVG